MKFIVSGMIAGDPHQGGASWAVLQYVLGLRQLGHDVHFVEPVRAAGVLDNSPTARCFHDVVSRFDLRERAALLHEPSRTTVGVAYSRLRSMAADCDALFNISGMLTDPALLERIPCRVYLDLDPAFNQLWHACEGIDMRFDAHTHFVTVGQALGTPACTVPTCGRAWIPTLPPVVLSEWPRQQPELRADAAWTTVANWRGYGSIDRDGVLYGQKAHSLRRFLELPRMTREPMRLALAIDPGETSDVAALDAHGWPLADPRQVAGTPDDYRAFIQRSKGEIGFAKSGYVESRCGWFSDRSVCYLASGRPVVAQDTGFSQYLPTGEGLLAFDDARGAAAAMEHVAADYSRHSRRARDIAETHFGSDRVLPQLLDRVAVSSHVPL